MTALIAAAIFSLCILAGCGEGGEKGTAGGMAGTRTVLILEDGAGVPYGRYVTESATLFSVG